MPEASAKPRATPQRAAAPERAVLSTLVQSLHLAVLVEGEDGRIAFTNKAFVSLFELPFDPASLAGSTVAELGPELYRRYGDPTAPARRRTGEAVGGARPLLGDRLVMTDGRVIERDFLPIVTEGVHGGAVWIFRDVSAQARAEAEWDALLARQREENERLVELDRIKSAFLAELSHELRTPLTSIMSFTELLADSVGRNDEVEQAEFLGIIRHNAERVLRLVDDLLFLDRIETGVMPIEWGFVDLAAVVSGSVAAFAPAAHKKSISLSAEAAPGPLVRGDRERLSQVMDIVLSNAVKFTGEGGSIVVRAGPETSEWRIEVTDDGIGVPAAEQRSLFERFYRASNARGSRIPGTGLGLAVARAIVELHGGTLTLASTVGEGTTVRTTLPLSAEAWRLSGDRAESEDGEEEQ